MKNIYVVMGTTGEYSDHTKWAVCAFHTKKEAQDFVVQADIHAREIELAERRADQAPRSRRRKPKHPMDPNFRMDYTGTSYSYMTVELRPKKS